MDHQDHVGLLRAGIPSKGGVWADLGAGGGAFTLALADLLGPKSIIYAIDRDSHRLRANADAMQARFPDVALRDFVGDFTQPMELPLLDGIVMANSLHFQHEQGAVVNSLRKYLAPGGRILVVEYNIDHGNFAVPYPVPAARWAKLAEEAGFSVTKALATRPSRAMREIYSAASW